ncbi:MAG: hypothetical protein R2853_05745 [Thermomicrobiales bacterium]|nr:hypothetical protein [Thermomicrobiales bacterium]
MKLLAIYDAASGEMHAVCTLPAEPDAPAPGARLQAGERSAVIEAPAHLASAEGGEIHAHLEAFIAAYRIEATANARPVRRSPA